MVFEAVLSGEARAAVSIAIARLVSDPRRFATKIQAREAPDAAIAVELSGPFVALLWTTSPSALGAAIQRHLGHGKKSIVGQLWLAARPRLLGGVPANAAELHLALDELLRRRHAGQRRPAMLAAARSVDAQGLATRPQLPSESPRAVGAPPVPRPASLVADGALHDDDGDDARSEVAIVSEVQL
jgi:hypothetical protein